MSPRIDIAIVECGTGNLHSIEKAVRRLAGDASVVLTSDPKSIDRAERVIFPGDGAFGHCMEQIDGRGLGPSLSEAARTKPFLGICVGMQLLFEHSEEGNAQGLGILPGAVVRFRGDDGLKTPHMGWNCVRLGNASPAMEGIEDGMRFYFIHSYYAAADPALAIATCTHGESFPAVVGTGDLVATQFHPEKSHRQGLRILSNFLLHGRSDQDGRISPP